MGDRSTLTDEVVAAIKARATVSLEVGGDAFFEESVFPQALAALENPGGTPTGSRPPFWSYDQQWMIGRWFDNRTSLIIDLPNGGMPPLTPEAMQRAERQRAARDASSPMRRQTVSEELASLDPGVVCRGGRIPMCGRGYNSNYQILKTADYVTLQDGDDA